MMHQNRRSAVMTGLLVLVLAITAATQAPVFKGGYFKTSDGNSTIGLDFDTTGAINVTVDGQAVSQSTWTAKADTMAFGPVTGPGGYNCAGSATYLWAIADNRITFTLVADDCQYRSQGLTGRVWTRG